MNKNLKISAWIITAFLLVAASKPVVPSLQQAENLEKAGKYLEARKIYEDLLKHSGLSGDKKKKIQKEYEALNLKVLYSKLKTPDSTIYTVQEKDRLFTIAQKFKTTMELIKKSNGLKNDIVYPGLKLKIEKGIFSIAVDKSKNILTLRLDGKPIKHYEIATGMKNGTPIGTFHIINKVENPTWYKAAAVIPPKSPKNFLGTRWLGFDYPGYGIHGTSEPESIGKHASSGCVRMRNKEVEELYSLVPNGITVTITD